MNPVRIIMRKYGGRYYVQIDRENGTGITFFCSTDAIAFKAIEWSRLYISYEDADILTMVRIEEAEFRNKH